MTHEMSVYHDAQVIKIEVDVENAIVSLLVLPYINVKPYLCAPQVLLFKNVRDICLLNYIIGEMYYIFDLQEEADGEDKLYTVQFNGPGRLEIKCEEMSVSSANGLKNTHFKSRRASHPDTGDTRILPGQKFF